MIVLITGGSGRLGSELKKVFSDSLAPSLNELDITKRDNVFKYIEKNKPEIIIHTAAMTDAENCEKKPKQAWEINVEGTRILLKGFKKFNPDGYFIYISTAGVFRCDRGNYAEDDCPNPMNFYCLTKLCGEIIAQDFKKILIVRTNFVPRGKWPYEKAFADRFGTYLYTDDVARAIKDVVEYKLLGFVHVCGDKKLSMYELAKLSDPNVEKITLKEYRGAGLPKDMSLITKVWHPYKLGGK